MDWVVEQLSKKIIGLSADTFADCFYKGEEFSGVLFINLPSSEMLDKTVNVTNKAKLNYKGTTVRVKKDSPIEQRAPLGVMLGLRWQLGQWCYNKSAIKVDDVTMTMTIADKHVLTITTDNDIIALDCKADDWKNWTALQNCEELNQLKVDANRKLKQAKDATKGCGKGKAAHQ